MDVKRWTFLLLTTLSALSLTSCMKPYEEGCSTCYYNYQARYSIHGCKTPYDQTCWVNCNTCSRHTERTRSNYWHSTVEACTDTCCRCLEGKKVKGETTSI